MSPTRSHGHVFVLVYMFVLVLVPANLLMLVYVLFMGNISRQVIWRFAR